MTALWVVLGLPDWFRRVYFSFHSQVRLRFKLAAGLGEPWCRDGGIPQGCPLSMVFIVALYVPWCRHLESLPDVKPQLYADNLKCSSVRPRALFESAYFTARYVRLVGQDVSPGKCVLLSTSRAVRRAMKLWDISGDGGFWKVQLDVRDLGGHLDFTYRARAGTLSRRIGGATVGVAAVGALPLGFQVKLGLVRGKYLPAGLHAAEASYVSSSSISAFRAAIVRAVWSSKMPLANAPAILNLLDGPVDVDPAFYVVWSRFRMMRRYLAYCPEEEPRIFRMLDLISRGAQGHGPVHLLLISAAEIGFAWDGDEKGWVRVSLPPLRMMAGPIQHFRTAILDAWHFHVFSKLSERKGFRGVEFADLKGSLQLLNSTHLRDRDKMLLRAILCGGVWNGFLLGKAKKEDIPCRFCGKKDGDGHLFWECSFQPSFSMYVNCLSLLSSCPWIVVSGLDVYSGMAGCLVLRVCLVTDHGLRLLVSWLPFILKGVLVLIRLVLMLPGLLLITGMLMILLWKCLSILTSGLMVAEKIFPLLGASRLLALELISLLLKLPLIIPFGARLKSMVMLGLSVAVLFFLSLEFCKLCNVLSSGVPLLLCRLTGLVIWVSTTLMSFVALVVCLMLVAWLSLFLWLRMVTWLLLSNT